MIQKRTATFNKVPFVLQTTPPPDQMKIAIMRQIYGLKRVLKRMSSTKSVVLDRITLEKLSRIRESN